MTFSLLNKKEFWITWLLLSLIGSYIGYTLSQDRDEALRSAETVELKEFREIKFPSIIAITSLRYQSEYLQLFEDTSINTTNIPFRAIEDSMQAMLLGFNGDSSLARIVIEYHNPKSARPPQEELWIHPNFINQKERNKNAR